MLRFVVFERDEKRASSYHQDGYDCKSQMTSHYFLTDEYTRDLVEAGFDTAPVTQLTL